MSASAGGVYADNLMGFVGHALASVKLETPASDGRLAFVSRTDVAHMPG